MHPSRSLATPFCALLAAFTIVAVSADNSPPLNVVTIGTTPDGFHAPARGWNSFGIQSNPATVPDFTFNQANVTAQCDQMSSVLSSGRYTYCSLDSGWSTFANGDEHGRIIADDTIFDLPALSDHLHANGLQLGVYVIPGAFCADANKTIAGTDIILNDTFSGNQDGFLRCDFDFSKDGTQQWHDSVVALFAQWGVDLIKLDYVTPGSPEAGGNLPANNSGSVVAYNNAIKASGRPIRLDISWKLDRNSTYFSIWDGHADSMRMDQDINNGEASTFVAWQQVQRTIEQYRQYITARASAPGTVVSLYPDMDNTYVGNPGGTSGVSDAQRYTIMNHWIGAAANLITGSDLTTLDPLGIQLLTDTDALAIADFTANYPMQPRNPGTGASDSQQLQAWIAGPGTGDAGNMAVVVLANLGPAEGNAGFTSELQGNQLVNASLADLGIEGTWEVWEVWGKQSWGVQTSVSKWLGGGESVLLKLTKVADGNSTNGQIAGVSPGLKERHAEVEVVEGDDNAWNESVSRWRRRHRRQSATNIHQFHKVGLYS